MNRTEVLELRRKRAGLIEEARGVLNESKDGALSAEQRSKYDRIMADVDALKGRIEADERVSAEERALEQSVRDPQRPDPEVRDAAAGGAQTPVTATPEYRSAFGAWARGGVEVLTPEQRSVLSRGRVQAEGRALTVTTSGGGYLIASDFQAALERAESFYGAVISAGARVMPTMTGGPMPWPTVNDTGNVGELLGINTGAATQDVAFGNLQLDAFKYSSKTCLVPFELMQDSEVDVPSLLGELLGERIARICNQHFTTGTGSGQPNGIATASTLGVTAAGAAAVTADELVDLEHSLNIAYRKRAKFMLEDATLKALKKLKDSEGRYLWRSGIAVKEPDTINGYPYVINEDMPSMATGQRSILFADFSKYIIRRVKGVELYRIQDKYIESGQVGFVAFARFDADLLNAGTNPVRHLIQA